ncbi:hypothetical protein AVEN_124248-1 [Araneus ventricosus]|uniref:Gustatory receptor n=1 Tax=Araneus ventricosus TaxID=182803 RepID=A0A4Y2M3C3_ARAVE|nr:hypothetical protein AVEN_260048-1 [Araneus ventricosus]GBN33223.1 hypothetical protein AVEN_124248-1 [Araneus ventricosus]
MFLFGVDVKIHAKNSGCKPSKWCSAYQRLVTVLWILYFLYTMLSVLIVDIPSATRISEVLPRKLRDVLAFTIWCVLKTRRKKIFYLLRKIGCLSNNLNVKHHPLWLTFTPVIVLGIPLICWPLKTWPFEEHECQMLMPHFSLSFSYVPEGQNCKVLSIISLLRSLATLSLKLAFTILYVLLCCLLRNILMLHSEAGAKRLANQSPILDDKYFKRYLTEYDSVIDVLNSFEILMSFPVLCVQIYDFMSIFYGIVNLDPIKELSHNTLLAKYFFAIVYVSSVCLVSFLCVSSSAASVHEASKRAKDVHERMFKQILASEQGIGREQLALLFVNCSSPAFTLSASGLYYFTKPMILAAVGSILTYSLLVMQF